MVSAVDHYEQLPDNEAPPNAIRRLAGARGPSPRVAFLIFGLIAGTVCVLENNKTSSPLAVAPLATSQLAVALPEQSAPVEPAEMEGDALAPAKPKAEGFQHWALVITLTIIVLVVAGLWYYGAHLLGLAVREYIQNNDQKFLGTEVTLDKVTIHPCTLKVVLRNLVVKNPKGDFTSKHLLQAHAFTVDVNMKKLLTSRGQDVQITKFSVVKVDAIVEYTNWGGPMLGGTSNLDKVLENLNKGSEEAKKPQPDPEKPDKPEDKKPEEESKRKITIKQLEIIDVGAEILTKTFAPRVAVGDVKYDDFTKEIGSSCADEIICLIFKTIAKSIVAGVAGKKAADAIM